MRRTLGPIRTSAALLGSTALTALTASLALAAMPATATAQETEPGCWVRGDPADLELRASPYDSTRVSLEGGIVKVCYSRPRKLGRRIMGGLVPYGDPWRFGANEATAIHLPARATVAGVEVEPGWYSLIAVPDERQWQLVVNGSAERWGIPIDEAVSRSDIGTGDVAARRVVGVVDLFTLELVRTGTATADLVMAWDRTRLRIPVALMEVGGAGR